MPVIVLLLILLIFLLAVAAVLTRRAVYPSRFPYLKTYQIEVERGYLRESDYWTWEKQEITLTSPYGYRLSATYFPLPGAERTVVLVHGITYTRLGCLKHLPLFRRLGFNVLIYDQRYHGLSGGQNCTFGFYERHDLRTVLDWALAHLPPGGWVGTMGESLGAAVCLQHAAVDPRPAFVIADCPFADLNDLLRLRLRCDAGLPSFPFLPLASLIARLQAGFWFGQVSPVRDMHRLTMPVLLIHGQQDDYIPPQHSRRLYDAKRRGLRRLYLAPAAGHAESYGSNPSEYERVIAEFLNECGVLG
ncbi:MAG: alpha/beta hydrolase [Chloroflexota bacterium]